MNDYISEDKLVNWVVQQGGVLHTRKISNIERVNLSRCKAKTLVCLTGYDWIINKFFRVMINQFTKPIILITIETDGFTVLPQYLEHPLLHHWFTWNKPIEHPKLTCIPEGLNYDRQEVILTKYLNKFPLVQNTESRKLLCMNCSLHTNGSRADLMKLVQTRWKDFCDVIDLVPPIQEYMQLSYSDGRQIKKSVTHPKCYESLSKYKFVLSPPGEGLDCHRTWEALYLNVIPIMLSSPIDCLFNDLPVVIVKDWNEINKDFLIEEYQRIQKRDDYNMDKLKLSYWFNTISESI